MRVTVKFFAILRERAGTSGLELEVPEGATVEAAAEKIVERYPAIREYLARSAFAVNRAYGPRGAMLRDGDELALIPPVSGG